MFEQGTREVVTPIRRPVHVGVVTTYAPSRCGIARFSASLIDALNRVAPQYDIDVVRLTDGDTGRPGTASARTVGMEFDPDCPVSVRAAARHLEGADLVLLQHEYGIYGQDDGQAIVRLVTELKTPIISVLHTVLSSPSARQRQIIERLAAEGTIVVPSRSARDELLRRYRVAPHSVFAIPHGADWTPAPAGATPRRRLISWGLLGPGKGFERAIAAVAQLRDLRPEVRYQIVGQTHPKVLRQYGQSYRQSLEHLVERMSMSSMIEFVDRYVDDEELYELAVAADVVLAPYDNQEQISSGVLIEAVAAGRPIVATRFPHAVELLADGAGVVVEHADTSAMADAIRRLLEDGAAYDAAWQATCRKAGDLSWDTVASEYTQLFSAILRKELVTA